MQAPGGPEEDPAGGFAHGGWSFGYWDDMMGGVMDAGTTNQQFDLLLGRKTYEIFAAYWPNADGAMARTLNGATKWVASRTLDRVDWANSQLIKGDVATGVAKLKRQDGPEIQVHGSGNLIQTLLAHDLVDEHRVWTFPVVVGRGKRLFAEGTRPEGLALADSKVSTTGVVMATYRPAGAIKSGSFATDEPSQAEADRRERMTREA
jgi:dihydrofolate reductase